MRLEAVRKGAALYTRLAVRRKSERSTLNVHELAPVDQKAVAVCVLIIDSVQTIHHARLQVQHRSRSAQPRPRLEVARLRQQVQLLVVRLPRRHHRAPRQTHGRLRRHLEQAQAGLGAVRRPDVRLEHDLEAADDHAVLRQRVPRLVLVDLVRREHVLQQGGARAERRVAVLEVDDDAAADDEAGVGVAGEVDGLGEVQVVEGEDAGRQRVLLVGRELLEVFAEVEVEEGGDFFLGVFFF